MTVQSAYPCEKSIAFIDALYPCRDWDNIETYAYYLKEPSLLVYLVATKGIAKYNAGCHWVNILLRQLPDEENATLSSRLELIGYIALPTTDLGKFWLHRYNTGLTYNENKLKDYLWKHVYAIGHELQQI